VTLKRVATPSLRTAGVYPKAGVSNSNLSEGHSGPKFNNKKLTRTVNYQKSSETELNLIEIIIRFFRSSRAAHLHLAGHVFETPALKILGVNNLDMIETSKLNREGVQNIKFFR
jgi:hypothetical protein